MGNGMGMAPAPIMGSRKNKLLKATRDTIIMTKKMQASHCKEVCAKRSPPGTPKKDREHDTICTRTSLRLIDIDKLMRGI